MKVEVLKVKCIKNVGATNLTIGKEYKVVEVEPQGYKIINDEDSIRRYHKDLFEKATNDVLIVECIDNSNQKRELSINKKYPVIKVKSKGYLIKNDIGRIEEYNSWRFNAEEPQKEILYKCYSKHCEHNKELSCTMELNSHCIDKTDKEINYVKECKKLKAENEILNKEVEYTKNEKAKVEDKLERVTRSVQALQVLMRLIEDAI